MIEVLVIAIMFILGASIVLMVRSMMRMSISLYVDDDIRLFKIEIDDIKHSQETRKVFIDAKTDSIESQLSELLLRLQKIEEQTPQNAKCVGCGKDMGVRDKGVLLICNECRRENGIKGEE